ncbi:tRNA uridine-5-carboxymethylaminomethyl(34) synthesis enzyme MnmG [Candidatus Atribacteria bacterium HGW-Atribacteria-1]|nr:MAG: tRNA uridine-5-carboxymethylaminomethyl(34) synthesis enzyme MnmG [Candidatus Atribacteria bacterium HGW-Atribacteria-1]
MVVGAGHAGCEAALAAARMGAKTLLITSNIDNVALMPCNPSIGGPGKGHVAREIDALGGEMAKNTDKATIHIRMLNTSKGPAMWALRAQIDKRLYTQEMIYTLQIQKNLDLKQEMVTKLIVNNCRVEGVMVKSGLEFSSPTVILTNGTFLNGKIYIGKTTYSAGRAGELASIGLAENLKELDFEVGRLNTCTPPRIDRRTVDFSKMKVQKSADIPLSFSFENKGEIYKDFSVFMTRTNQKTHQIIQDNIHRVPLSNGTIQSAAIRYCPSVEDKIIRFPEKESHQIFLEPEGYNTEEIYLQGFFTSLPADAQQEALHTIEGLENCKIVRYGYAIEYDIIYPNQLKCSLETKAIKGLFLAGQVNGTSGYEEAAEQGLLAGINAVQLTRGKEPLILDRSEAYIAVEIDDLVTKSVTEPYRLRTGLAEYRLLLRQDNADLRLTPYGYKLGLISEQRYKKFLEKKTLVENEKERLKEVIIHATQKVNELLNKLGTAPLSEAANLAALLTRPEVTYNQTASIDLNRSDLPAEVTEQVEIQIKYAGYIKRQEIQVKRFKKLENYKIPKDIDYFNMHGISHEGKERFSEVQPISLGQAKRIPGITPSDIAALMINIEKIKRMKK